jgi:hypothetical protein
MRLRDYARNRKHKGHSMSCLYTAQGKKIPLAPLAWERALVGVRQREIGPPRPACVGEGVRG